MDDLVSDFLCEAAEGLGGLQAGLARLAADPADVSAAPEMLRRLHGLKGVCGFVGFGRAEALAHAGEGLLSALAAAPAPVSAAMLAPVGAMIERLSELFADAAAARGEPEGDDGELIGLIEETALAVRGRADGEPGSAGPVAAPASAMPALLRGAMGAPGRRTSPPWSGLDTLARALGDRLGKRIDLMVGGDDIRIAPQAAAALRTALIALVRNACDHGVETPAERRQSAKPALSLLRLSVQRAPDGAVIEIADDGRGVDPAGVRQRCLDLGRLDAAAAAALSDRDAQALIFAPGVTTAPAVTALSGRGLGLELVRREVERLGGRVELNSTPGQGARFVISLPASVLATPAARSRAAA
jgi:two-component system chemotaxis sensor kinase CheA